MPASPDLTISEGRRPPCAATPAPDFASFFAVSLDLMVIRDSDFRIVKVNQAWETVLGYSMDELEGQSMLSFIHPDDLRPSHAQMQRVGREKEVRSFINRYRCRDGSYRSFEWRARQEGDLVYGVARDVTERLAIEAEMAAAKAAAEAASKAKSEFLANMSHEIRTPLNGVIGVASALARTELSPQQREMVDLVLSSGQTLDRVVSDVLDFSKIEAGRLELDIRPFDLRPEMAGLVDLFRVRAEEKGLSFEVAYGPGADAWLLSDVVRIKQVLGNLVSNAIKFTAAGAVAVSIDVEDLDEPGHAALRLQVRDTGIGFDPAFARNMFQRFSQADGSITRRFGGTGLGLSICQSLVELLGGEISATSDTGRGSRFDVRIPLRRHERPSNAQPLPSAAANTGETGPIDILLVEDHAINRRVVELILEPAGVRLTVAENGEEALVAYRTGAFDLILMDMQMPVMDGIAATKAIRALEAQAAQRPRTPIIMLTANAMREHGEEAIAAGADLHLSKPVTPASLLGAITHALGRAGDSPAQPRLGRVVGV